MRCVVWYALLIPLMYYNVGQIRMILQFCPKSLLPHLLGQLGQRMRTEYSRLVAFSAQMWEVYVECSLENVSYKHSTLSSVSHSLHHGNTMKVSLNNWINHNLQTRTVILQGCRTRVLLHLLHSTVIHWLCLLSWEWNHLAGTWLTISDIKILHLSHNYPS